MILRSGRNLKEKSEATPIDPSDHGAVSMEPPAVAAPTPHSKSSKKRRNSASSMEMDAEVVKISSPTTLSKSKKMKEAQVSTYLANSVKVSKPKKGKKAITDKSHADTQHSRSSLNSASGIESPKTRQPTEPFKTSLIDPQDDHIAGIIKRYELFKKFDTVQDYSDHHYITCSSSQKQQANTWTKRIQEEWKILEKDLPDKIFVRAYEERMDLMRAVIVGAEGTPYHDGLFFFDLFFPSSYPNNPPLVHYHSHGLRLNPNLYVCGAVCVSLLKTWVGKGDPMERWQQNISTMLQVLVSIQGLILNAKPYFNDLLYASSSGTDKGERESLKYNESTFILSLKTMSYTMRKPPKIFEELVVGHFMTRAQDILEACNAYLDGAPIGSVVEGKVQDLHKSSSKNFRESLSSYLPLLGKDLTNLGLKGVDSFLPLSAASPPPVKTTQQKR